MTKKSDVLAKLGLILIEAEIRQQKRSSQTEELTLNLNPPRSIDGRTTQNGK